MFAEVNVEPRNRKQSRLLATGPTGFVVVVRQDESSCDSTVPAHGNTATVPPWPRPDAKLCWTMLRAAAVGDASAKSMFARSYTAPIRAYLGHRWRNSRLAAAIDDALQDVFVECIEPGGAIERADPTNGEFRALLYAVVRNVARRHEERAARTDQVTGSVHLDDLPDRAEALSRFFDRSWAEAIVREAILRHARIARCSDVEARRRYRVLRLRHQDGLPIREIAARLEEASIEAVHNAYRRALREFREHLRATVAHHTGAAPDALDAECRRVTELLGP